MRSTPASEGVTACLAAAGAGVAGLVEAVQAGALHGEGHDELSGLLAEVRSVQARLEFVVLATVREVDVQGSFTSEGALTAGAWARMHTRMTPAEASGAVRTARVLGSGELPATAAALARYEKRGLTLSPLPDGSVYIRGLADEVTGALLATAINAANPPVPGDRRSAAQSRIDAVADIFRKYLGSPEAPMTGGGHAHLILTTDTDTMTYPTNPADDHETTGNPRPPGHTDTHADGGAGAGGSGAGGPGAGGAGPGGTLCWVGPVAGSTARRVSCDADVTYVTVDHHGHTEVVRRETRFFSWAQRKAMIARDGDRCPVPFCDRPIAWSDGHHLQHWAQGGATTTDNGALPCAAHHTLLHEGGWTLHRQPDGTYLIRHHTGKTIGPEPHPPGHNRPTPHPRT